MPKVTEEHKSAMRRRIQDAALACFARRGFAGSSMADIVREAELSAGAVYVYYASKAELMIDVSRRVMEPRLAVLETAREGGQVTPPAEVFGELLDSLLTDNPFAPVMVQVWAEASFDRDFADFAGTIFDSLIEEFTSYLAAFLHEQRGMDVDAARTRASVVIPGVLAMIQGAVIQATIFGEASGARVRSGVADLLSRIEF